MSISYKNRKKALKRKPQEAELGTEENPYHLDKDKCNCQGWGCKHCCKTDADIRARSGTFG